MSETQPGAHWPTEHPDPLRAGVYQALNRIDAIWDDEHASRQRTMEKVADDLQHGLIASERQANAAPGALAALMRDCAHAMFEDRELTLGGNGVNASEASPALQTVAEHLGIEGPKVILDRLYKQSASF